ncbi:MULTISPECIES: hypothetical protein [Methylobacterium]|nr:MULTISPECIES: hypothetical protein [Methylobacterium]
MSTDFRRIFPFPILTLERDRTTFPEDRMSLGRILALVYPVQPECPIVVIEAAAATVCLDDPLARMAFYVGTLEQQKSTLRERFCSIFRLGTFYFALKAAFAERRRTDRDSWFLTLGKGTVTTLPMSAARRRPVGRSERNAKAAREQ